MRSQNLCLLLALAASAHSLVVPRSHVQHERRDYLPRSWVKRGKVSPQQILPMRIGLKQKNLEFGADSLLDISHPNSENYSKHWTPDEVIEAFAPDQVTVDAIRAWLIEAGIDGTRITHSGNRGWLAFDATTEEAENLLLTEFHEYEHTETGHVTKACDSYHVPANVRRHLDYVTPGIRLLAPRVKNNRKRSVPEDDAFKLIPAKFPKSISNTSELATCDVAITPACVAALYQIPPVAAGYKARADNSLGIFEEGDYYAQEDLDLFFANFTTIPQGTSPIPAFIDGAVAPVPVDEAGGESDLDFELSYPIIYPQTITLYQTDDIYYATEASGGFLNTFLDALDGSYCDYLDPLDPVYPDTNSTDGYEGTLNCGIYTPTNVISISYGGQEVDLPAAYQIRQCTEFMKLGLQGVSIMFASGDSGVAGRPGGDDECLGPNADIFSPDWPANCPWVTAVGATKVYPGQTVYDPESAVVDPAGHPYSIAFSSGGGFSNIYGTPSYQQDAVATFFADHNPPYPYYSGNDTNGTGIYNRIGRGYPDVAANGDNIAVFNEGEYGTSGGTSASAPIFSSIINRINEERLNSGKKSLGFLNPALYSNPSMLNDITNGTNPGCNTVGFSAVSGWDPVTGLGTPNYPKMLEYFLSLP